MIRSLFLLFVYLSFLGLGVVAPFVMTLGYVWVDTFQPQYVAYVILNQFPVALIMGGGAVLSYLALDRRFPPMLTVQSVLQILLAIWMTMTLLWAEVPGPAFDKWDVAFKGMVFSAFIPLVIRSRIQIEAFAQTYVFALAANFLPFGMKVLMSGGGYGRDLGLVGGNSGLGESGYLATTCLMAVPIMLALSKNTLLMPKIPLVPLGYLGMVMLALITAIGTHERGALLGIAVLGINLFMRSRRKFMFLLLCIPVAFAISDALLDSWTSRGTTMTEYSSENSAFVRILVWRWTFDYSLTHPWGGSFNSFFINSIVIPGDALNPDGSIQFGRAFHSIYFEVLGELGWPGLIMFMMTIVSTMLSLRGMSKKCRKIPELVWLADMADALQTGIVVFMTTGAFLGIAFQPTFWYFVAMAICLRAHLWRVEHNVSVPVISKRRSPRQVTAEPVLARTPVPRNH